MSETTALIKRARRYAEKSGRSLTTVSRKILGDGTRIAALEAGKSSAFKDTLEKANETLAKLEADLAKARA